MTKVVFSVFIIFNINLFCLEPKKNEINNLVDLMFPLKYIGSSPARLIINLRFLPASTANAKMIIIEYYNLKCFKATYYYISSYYNDAKIEEVIKYPSAYIGLGDFTENECPFFGKLMMKIYKMVLKEKPRFKESGLYLDVDIYDIVLSSGPDTIEIEKISLAEKLEKMIQDAFLKAEKCIEKNGYILQK